MGDTEHSVQIENADSENTKGEKSKQGISKIMEQQYHPTSKNLPQTHQDAAPKPQSQPDLDCFLKHHHIPLGIHHPARKNTIVDCEKIL